MTENWFATTSCGWALSGRWFAGRLKDAGVEVDQAGTLEGCLVAVLSTPVREEARPRTLEVTLARWRQFVPNRKQTLIDHHSASLVPHLASAGLAPDSVPPL